MTAARQTLKALHSSLQLRHATQPLSRIGALHRWAQSKFTSVDNLLVGFLRVSKRCVASPFAACKQIFEWRTCSLFAATIQNVANDVCGDLGWRGFLVVLSRRKSSTLHWQGLPLLLLQLRNRRGVHI